MNFSSKFSFFNFKSKKKEEGIKKPVPGKIIEKGKKIEEEDNLEDNLPNVDTNVISINFRILKDLEKSLGTGDPFFCKTCKAVLNSFSKLYSANEYIDLCKKRIQSQKNEKIEEKPNEIKEEKVEEQKKIIEKPKIKMEEEKKKSCYWRR